MIGRFPLTILVYLGFAVWAVDLAIQGVQVPGSIFAPVHIVVPVLLGALWLFDNVLWAARGINSVYHRPDLRGTWKGELRSSQEGAPPRIEAYLSIDQTFSTILVRQFTQASASCTRLASIAPLDGGDVLVGVYQNEPQPSYKELSQNHHGAFKLSVLEGGRLKGHYWADQGNVGEMTFTRVCNKPSTDYDSASGRARSVAKQS